MKKDEGIAFWLREAKEKAGSCLYPDARRIIEDYYNAPPDRRSGTFQELRLDDLRRGHILKEECSSCTAHLEELQEGDALRWPEQEGE